MKGEIARLLLENEAVSLNVDRPYTYASGIRSPIYCDNRKLLGNPSARTKIVDSFLELLYTEAFDVVVGVATAGIPWAAIIADRLGKPLLYVRDKAKGHGKQNTIEGSYKDGMRAVVIEDLISTGSSSLAAIKTLEEEGLVCTLCVAIFTYGLPEAKEKFKNTPLKTLSDFSTLLVEAQELRIITKEQESTALQWNKNPHSWKGRESA